MSLWCLSMPAIEQATNLSCQDTIDPTGKAIETRQ